MNPRIHRLSESIVRKIAAGEVIERPASVVKELVENAVDAGARRIRIEVVDGGRQGIRVVDDGCGMTREDVELCTERHATSKMSTPSDLFTIQTLGFRGEALASIGGVSRLTIETRTADADAGTRLVVEGGVRRELTISAHDVGTSIEVQGLFFNTPARRKFLRHSDTEMRHLTQAVVRLAAAWPEVAFRLVHGDREVLDLPVAPRRQRAAELIGADPQDLLAADLEREVGGGGWVRIEGLLTPPQLCRQTRAKQFLVVRQRPIHARSIVQSVYSGFGSLLPGNTHPRFVLWLDLDPRHVDVNVHPTKSQVRFAREAELRQLMQDAVRQALPVPEAPGFNPARTSYLPQEPPSYRVSDSDRAPSAETWKSAEETGETQMSLSLLSPSSPEARVLTAGGEGAAALEEARQSPVWQVHDKYLLVAIREGLLVVDQHVAHERVRFEEVLDDLRAEAAASQQLLIPLTVEVSPVEKEAFREASELFEHLGFGVREFGATTLLVDAVPPGLRHWDDGNLFYRILSDLIEELETRAEARDALAASMACHTSIRAGERLSPGESQTLVSRLLAAREPFACPHGRPILVKIPLRELDRLFHRT